MQGRVKMFSQDKGYGFILGEDGYDYFCHISEIHSVDMPTANSIVEFQPSETERGKKAISVTVVQKYEQRPEFINLGNHRIKVSKIRNYRTITATDKELVYKGKWYEANIYKDVEVAWHIYIYMSDETTYTITYTQKDEFVAACQHLDKILGTVKL